MLSEEQYAAQRAALGARVHFNDGVWWEEAFPFYCKPVNVHRSISPKESRPRRLRSILGYSHRVSRLGEGNRTVSFMVLDGDRLRSYDLKTIGAKKRNQVRKGMRKCSVDLLSDLEAHLERMRAINIHQAQRQERGAGTDVPAARYVDDADSWRTQVRREHALAGREWRGAFVGGELAAYSVSFQVEEVLVIEKVKSDQSYSASCPVDALYHTLLTDAAARESCRSVVNGRPQHKSLNHYKEQFLFRTVEYPYYSSNAKLVEFAKKHLRGIR